MTVYSIESAQALIENYMNEGGSFLEMCEGVLGLGDFLLYDESGKLKFFVVREVALNEWSSGQTIRAHKKIPKKYLSIIEKA